jgi:hypothetical protein
VCGILCLWDAFEDFKRFHTEETEGLRKKSEKHSGV